MTFKDLLRLVRRRWPVALLAFLVVFAGFLLFSRFKEHPQFRARAHVFLSTPPVFLSASQGAQWISITPVDARTWISIIQGLRVRTLTKRILETPQYAAERKMLKIQDYAPDSIQEDWLSSISAVPDSGEQLLWIEAVAPSEQVATDIANAAARAAVLESVEKANHNLTDSQEKAETSFKKDSADIKNLELQVLQKREDARAQYGSENLEFDVRKLQEELLTHETRRRELERRSSANRLKLERVREDRAATEHVAREAVPRTASGQLRIYENPRVKALSERLELLHRDLNTLLRKYTNEHPTIKGLRADILHSEVELTQAEAAALGRDLDEDELKLRADNDLMKIELRVLEPEVRELRDRQAILSPILDDVTRLDREIADAKARLVPLQTLLTQLQTAPAATGYVQIQDPAETAGAVAIEMKLRKSWPVALMAAVIIGLSFAFLVDFLDTSIRNDYDVRRHLDLPVLAIVPRVASEEVLTVQSTRTTLLAEIYDTLATVLLSVPSPQRSRIFMVTSTNPREGKTAVSINLAVALARQGRPTLLIDGDMRIPAVHSAIGLANSTGLSELLSGMVELGTEGVLQGMGVPNLKVMTSGVTPENPYELLDPARIAPVGANLREQFDAIVVDTPPVLLAGDPLKFSSLADSVLFVIKAGATDVRQASWAKRLLANVSAKLTGVVLNGTPRDSGEYYHDPYSGTGRPQRAF